MSSSDSDEDYQPSNAEVEKAAESESDDDDDDDEDEDEDDAHARSGMDESEEELSEADLERLQHHPFVHWLLASTRPRTGRGEAPPRNTGFDTANPPLDYERCITNHIGGVKQTHRLDVLNKRETRGSLSAAERVQASQLMLPLHHTRRIDSFAGCVFCCKYSKDGTMFMAASQDGKVALYDTATWNKFKEIEVEDVGWSIIDIDYSPDQRFIIYSSWSQHISLCNVSGEYELHEQLVVAPGLERTCMFGIRFDPGSTTILAGLNQGGIVLYDVAQKRVVSRVNGHDDDVNTVCFDEFGDHFYTGSDDGLIKVWDRRLFGKEAAGVLCGHDVGITCVAAKKDGRHIISNGKDSSLRLWDIRKMKTGNASNIPRAPSLGFFSRFGGYGAPRSQSSCEDLSIKQFVGHSVSRTLIRCGFSPMSSTGQRYVFSGSSSGSAFIYDLVTGEHHTVGNHDAIVRSCDWHPYFPELVTASWDCTLKRHRCA